MTHDVLSIDFDFYKRIPLSVFENWVLNGKGGFYLMEQCPKCGAYMQHYFINSVNVPMSGWRCLICGYDTNKLKVIWSNTTNPIFEDGKNEQNS